MGTRIVRQDHGLISLPRTIFRDSSLSFAAKGLLLEVLSYEEGDLHESTDFSARGHEDAAAIRAAMDLLEQRGYLTRTAQGAMMHETPSANDEPCPAETWSWNHFTPNQVDPYWIRCTLRGDHAEHEDENTGLAWKPEGAQEETP